MTFGQFSELLFMLTLPFFFKRIGVKYTLVLGMLAWVVRYLCFGFGNADALVWMLYLGIVLHGICYDFFFVTGQVYVDRKRRIALRAAAQGLIIFITYGIGMFVGSWICGKVVDMHATTSAARRHLPRLARDLDGPRRRRSLVVLIFFLIGFRDEKNRASHHHANRSTPSNVPVIPSEARDLLLLRAASAIAAPISSSRGCGI